MELSASLELIKDFLSPVSQLEKVGLNEISVSTILNNILVNFETKHKDYYTSLVETYTDDPEDAFWKFGFVGISLIKNLNESKFEINPNGCYLSINEDRLLNSCCQLVTCFGIHYNLEDNVGISIDKLSKYGVNILIKRDKVGLDTRNKRLARFLNFLYEIKQNKRPHIDVINGTFYRRYMHDLIAALIQVSNSPNSNELNKKEHFSKWLETDLYEEADGSAIVSSLIMAQGNIKNRPPEWFTRVVGKLLTKCLMRPNSVMNVIRAVLNEINAVSSVSVASDWKKCDVVAKILTQCPRELKIEDYIKFIAPQILNLFFNIDVKYARHFYRVAGSVYSLFAQRWPKLTKIYITNQIIAPLLPNLEEKSEDLSISGNEFRKNLHNLHLVYVASTEPNWQTLTQIPTELVYLIFQVYMLLNKKINAKETRTLCEDILKLYVKMMPNQNNEILIFIVNMLEFGLLNERNVGMVSSYFLRNNLKFDGFDDSSEDECVILYEKSSEHTNDQVTVQMVEKRSRGIIDLLKAVNDKELDVNLMVYLFEKINNYYESNQIQTNPDKKQTKTDRTLLDFEEKVNQTEIEINLKIIYFTQLSALLENLDPQLIIEKHNKIIEFCQLILKNILNLVKTNDLVLNRLNNVGSLDQEESVKYEYETIHLILSIISIFTTGFIEIEYSVKKELQVFLPLLSEIKSIYVNTEIESMSDALRISIATYCGIKTEPTASKTKSLIEEIGDSEVKVEDITAEEDYNKLDDYEKSIRDLKDPLIPVRAHGMVVLRKLIEKKNEKCISNINSLTEQFIKGLKSDDSYLYLAAITGLISLVDYDPNKILDILIEQYLNMNNKLDVENRLKVGEVLTKSIRNFYELAPKYGPKLINTFLIGTKHSDELFRSSCLSNMGEICKLLNYSIQQNIYEIINCISSLLETDRSVQVKRSSILVLKMIIEGLRKEDFIQVLGDSVRPLYRLLSKTIKITDDDIIKLNCQLTNEYLNELMQSALFPKQKLEKEIKVLRA